MGVFHRDHRLRSEVLHQRSLLVGERADFLAVDRDRAEQFRITTKCDPDTAAQTTRINELPKRRSGLVTLGLGDVCDADDALALQHSTQKPGTGHRLNWSVP